MFRRISWDLYEIRYMQCQDLREYKFLWIQLKSHKNSCLKYW